jgi:hypothetical protein
VLVVEEHFGHQKRYADKGRSVREQQRPLVNVTKVFFPVRVDVNIVVLYIICIYVSVVDIVNVGNFIIIFFFQHGVFFFQSIYFK